MLAQGLVVGGTSIKGGILVAIWHQKCFDLLQELNLQLARNIPNMKVLLQFVLCVLGIVMANEVKPLRQTLHGTLARVAPTTIKEAVVVTMSEGACLLYTSPSPRD